MDAELVIPWLEVVKLKQQQDEHLLQAILHYEDISKDERVPEPSREEAKKLMRFYQRKYLGLPSGI